MLVCSRAQYRLLSPEDAPSFYDVREDHSIQVSNMRGSVHVKDGRCDVVWLLRCRFGRIEPSGFVVHCA